MRSPTYLYQSEQSVVLEVSRKGLKERVLHDTLPASQTAHYNPTHCAPYHVHYFSDCGPETCPDSPSQANSHMVSTLQLQCGHSIILAYHPMFIPFNQGGERLLKQFLLFLTVPLLLLASLILSLEAGSDNRPWSFDHSVQHHPCHRLFLSSS